MSVCPAGHDSAADDYCDVCGLPIGSEPAPATASGTPAATEPTDPPPAEPAPPAPEESTCPNCGAVGPPNALFCEACGYDFTTGAAPRPAASMLDLDAPAVEQTAEKLPAVPADDDVPSDPPAPSPAAPATPEPPADPAPTATAETPAAPAPPAGPAPPAEPVAPALAEEWVAEVWIDPDWYTAQDSSDPLPSAGVPTVLPLRTRSALVGRTSRSRGIAPDIDLSSDNGISRRHCQFTTDGTRWWVEDLGSSNGTYVGSTTGTLPTVPITPGDKREIRSDEQVYLGAWTRIVLRKAMPGEV